MVWAEHTEETRRVICYIVINCYIDCGKIDFHGRYEYTGIHLHFASSFRTIYRLHFIIV